MFGGKQMCGRWTREVERSEDLRRKSREAKMGWRLLVVDLGWRMVGRMEETQARERGME